MPPLVTGPLATTTTTTATAVVGTIQNTPLAADPGDGTEDVFTVNQGGDILWRKGDSQAPGSFSAPVTINPGDPSRAIAFVPTQSNDLLASVDDETIATAIRGVRDMAHRWTAVPPGGKLRLSWPLGRDFFGAGAGKENPAARPDS